MMMMMMIIIIIIIIILSNRSTPYDKSHSPCEKTPFILRQVHNN